MAQTDSILVTTGDGSRYQKIPTDLPLDSLGQIATISAIIYNHSNEFTVGLRGQYSVDTVGTPILVSPGGIYHTTNRGVQWVKISNSEIDDLTVISMHSYNDAILVWATRRIENYASGGYSLQQTASNLYRYDRNTSQFTLVYSEDRTRPAFSGSMAIVTLPNGHLVSATTEHWVISSTDGGLSWAEVGELPYSAREIFDIALDSNGNIYASTRDGIFVYNYIPTSVNEPTDDVRGSRFFTVWCYPTPSKDVVTVRLSNPDILQSGITSAKIIDTRGVVVKNVSSAFSGQIPLSRFETTLNVSDLPKGLLLLVLDSSAGTRVGRIFIAE